MNHDLSETDIMDVLLDMAYIVDKAAGKAAVVMLDGSLFQEAAGEIKRLREVVDTYKRHLSFKEPVDL